MAIHFFIFILLLFLECCQATEIAQPAPSSRRYWSWPRSMSSNATPRNTAPTVSVHPGWIIFSKCFKIISKSLTSIWLLYFRWRHRRNPSRSRRNRVRESSYWWSRSSCQSSVIYRPMSFFLCFSHFVNIMIWVWWRDGKLSRGLRMARRLSVLCVFPYFFLDVITVHEMCELFSRYFSFYHGTSDGGTPLSVSLCG